MMERVLRIACALIGVALIVGSFIGSEGFTDGATQEAMLPPCDVEEGLPFVQDDEVTCYWGMSAEILELDKEVDLATVLVDISWIKSGVWIGIAEASEASKCTEKDGYYQCEKGAIDLVAGGENSNGQFTWNASSGDYRFVAGGDDVQSLQQFDVTWNFEATLPQSTSWGLVVVGGLLCGLALMGKAGVSTAFALFNRP
ncbi:hypothetical protein N9A87_02690 [Euryarchaeota archaeon]|nr:hypothetical protein [Euryarchaeota archaeon]|tara:strand:+ start:4850 stop:5446 length:597 start_codon:yes stop_codon:yes gene_type:complete